MQQTYADEQLAEALAASTDAATYHSVQDAARLRSLWSAISEPGAYSARVHTLIETFGYRGATTWVQEPFVEPDVARDPVHGPTWKELHRNLKARLSAVDISSDLSTLEGLGGRLLTPTWDGWDRIERLAPQHRPHVLWAQGTRVTHPAADSSWLSQPTVTISGSRAATSYGTQFASDLAYDLAASGVHIVTGGSYGIDAAATRAALTAIEEGADANLTVILPGGLAQLYPVGHADLFAKVVEHGGTLLAELPPNFRPARWRFLERNRILAAMSDLVVIVEGGQRSGAAGLARWTNDLQLPLGAVPGPLTSPASGLPNALLREGLAKWIENSDDALHLAVPRHILPDSIGSLTSCGVLGHQLLRGSGQPRQTSRITETSSS